MTNIIVPIATAAFTFILGYFSYRVRTKEQKVEASTNIMKLYNDLIDQLQQEIERKNEELKSKDEAIKRMGDQRRPH